MKSDTKPVQRSFLNSLLRWATGIWVLVLLLSLRLGLLNAFFFDTLHADVQGIDFYSLPKAWLNLATGHSPYATFDPPTYGPHFTWYLAHPALGLLGWPLSRLSPADSYGAFTIASLAVMACSAWVLARETENPVRRALVWLLLVGAFPTFDMLWVGNVQSFTVLGLALLYAGMLRLVRHGRNPQRLILAGLLLSLFTKPVVLLACPLLLLLPETRRSAARALAVYLGASLAFELLPPLNPESVGLRRVAWLATHPAFVRRTMNIYANHFLLTPDMRDNSIHWLNLVAQSGTRLAHIDVFSLPVFLDTLLGVHTPAWLYLLPPLAVLLASVLVAGLRLPQLRAECALLLTLAASLSFFLSYPTVWEYQYTAVLPVAAVLLLLPGLSLLGALQKPSLLLASCAWLPSLYFLSGTANPDRAAMTLVRFDRIVPVTLLFLLLLWAVTRAVVNAFRHSPSPAAPIGDCSSPAGSLA